VQTKTAPSRIEDITPEFLTPAARRLLADDSAVVTALRIGASEPFEYPKFGNKRFDVIEFEYEGRACAGNSRMILRRLPPRDAVSLSLTPNQPALEQVFVFRKCLRVEIGEAGETVVSAEEQRAADRPEEGGSWSLVIRIDIAGHDRTESDYAGIKQA